MYLLILTTLFVLFAILAWRNLKSALILLSGLLPIYLLRFDIGPIPSTALEILILICIVIWILKLTKPNERKNLFKNASQLIRNDNVKWIHPIILLIAAASFGVAVAPDVFSALGIWKAYFIEPILVALMMITIFDRNDWMKCLQALSVSAIVLSIFAIFQYSTGIGIPIPWDIELRVTSIFEYPNALGLFLAPIVTLNLILLILNNPLQPSLLQSYGRHSQLPLAMPAGRQKNGESQKITQEQNLPSFSRRGRGWLSLVSILLGLIAIVLSQTEAALVAIPVAVTITLLASNISKNKKGFILGFAVILAVLAISTPAVRSKLFLQDYSGQVRISQWTETLELIKEKPFFGAGLNGYPTALAPHHDSTIYEIFQYPHNIFLNIWAELGILGLITFFWFTYLIIRTLTSPHFSACRQAWQGGAGGGYQNPIKLALFAALLTILIHGLVDVPYFKNDLTIMTWIFLSGFIVFNKKYD